MSSKALGNPGKLERRASLGLSSLSNQVYRKATKKGFEFTIMVCGEANLGKTTLLNTLFLSEEEAQARDGQEDVVDPPATESITLHTFNITEKGVSLRLTVVDTPGYAEHINASNCWQPLVDYLDNAYHQYLTDESKVDRQNIEDHRVHCCLYFINPSQHGLKPLDIATLTKIHRKVNVIPLIAKADTLTKKELTMLKDRLLDQFSEHRISIFRPGNDADDDEATVQNTLKLLAAMPFAVIGSNKQISVGGKVVRGRQYPWGIVEVDNEDHCDFTKLRNMIVRTHLQDLKDVTSEVLYEAYRKEALQRNPSLAAEALNRRGSIEQAEQEQALLDSEAELVRRHEQMKRDIEEQARLLEEKRRAFEEERRRYEESMRLKTEQQQSTASIDGLTGSSSF